MRVPGYLEALGLAVVIVLGMLGAGILLDLIMPSQALSRLLYWFLAFQCLNRASWDSLGWRWSS